MSRFFGCQPCLIDRPNKDLWIIGHRGFPRVAPENTLTSFEKAIEYGADMVELDVTLSREGVPVVIHDSHLSRTTDGKGFVRRHSLSSLRKLDAGSWFGKEFRQEFIPTLSEVFELFGSRISINIEIKKESFSKRQPWVVEAVLRTIEDFGLRKSTVVSSFSPEVVRQIKRKSSKQPTAILVSNRGKKAKNLIRQTGADALHVSLECFSESLVEDMDLLGIPVRVFTINEKRTATRLFRQGAQAVFTDEVKKLAG